MLVDFKKDDLDLLRNVCLAWEQVLLKGTMLNELNLQENKTVKQSLLLKNIIKRLTYMHETNYKNSTYQKPWAKIRNEYDEERKKTV